MATAAVLGLASLAGCTESPPSSENATSTSSPRPIPVQPKCKGRISEAILGETSSRGIPLLVQTIFRDECAPLLPLNDNEAPGEIKTHDALNVVCDPIRDDGINAVAIRVTNTQGQRGDTWVVGNVYESLLQKGLKPCPDPSIYA